MNQEEYLEKAHEVLLKLLLEFDRVCKKYDVQYYSFAKKSTDSSTGTETKLTDKQIKEYTKKLNELAVKAKTAKDFTKLLGSEKESGVTYNSGNFTEKEGWSTYLSDANLKKIKKMKLIIERFSEKNYFSMMWNLRIKKKSLNI